MARQEEERYGGRVVLVLGRFWMTLLLQSFSYYSLQYGALGPSEMCYIITMPFPPVLKYLGHLRHNKIATWVTLPLLLFENPKEPQSLRPGANKHGRKVFTGWIHECSSNIAHSPSQGNAKFASVRLSLPSNKAGSYKEGLGAKKNLPLSHYRIRYFSRSSNLFRWTVPFLFSVFSNKG